MFRKKTTSGLLICTVKILVSDSDDGPYYNVFTDADTESVGYFASADARWGEQVLPAFSCWTRESLKLTVVEHAQKKAGLTPADANILAQQIADCLSGREMNPA